MTRSQRQRLGALVLALCGWAAGPGGLTAALAQSPAPAPTPGNPTIHVQGTLIEGSALPLTMTFPRPLVVAPALPPSGPVCGGMVNGVAQPACPDGPATRIGPSRNQCDVGSFFDLTTWSCWSCPAGFVRSAAPVISEQACSQQNASLGLERLAATLVGPRCPAGSFFDPIRGGECWRCPAGHVRSAAHVEADNACYVPAGQRFSAAARLKQTAWAWDCAAGSFWDGWAGGACWSCPAGMSRTASPINTVNACAQAVPEQRAKAELVSKGECESGTIFDPRNGGECWRCPTGALRTVFPVDQAQACERPAGVRYAEATKTSTMTCRPGEHFDPIEGGSCWTCPDGFSRTASPVNGDKACRNASMLWKSTPFPEPGLFTLDGAADVLYEVVRTNPALVRDALNAAAATVAKQSGVSVVQARSTLAKEMVQAPGTSVVAQGLVLTRLIAAASEPARASSGERRLIAAFAAHIQAKRTHIARDRLAAYDNWAASDDYWRARRNLTKGLAGTVSYGTVPPSFDKLGMVSTIGISTASTSLSMGIEVTTEALKFAKAASRLSIIGDLLGATLSLSGAGWSSNTSPELVAISVSRSVAEIAVGQALGALLTAMAQVPAAPIVSVTAVASTAGMPAAVLSTTGPALMVAAQAMMLGIAIDQFVQIQEARPKLVNAVTFGQTAPDLRRMLQTQAGVGEIQTLWSQAMETPSLPPEGFMAVYGGLAQGAGR